MTSGTKKMIKEHLEKNLENANLKIPKALSNRVFIITASIFEICLGDKVEENDKRTCLEKKIFSNPFPALFECV